MTIYAETPDKTLTTTQRIRNNRLYLLQACDWTVAIDSPLSDSKKAEWTTYRQALRDLPSSYTDSDNYADVVFPTEPS
jgi:predicted nuclease with RNAse H fold